MERVDVAYQAEIKRVERENPVLTALIAAVVGIAGLVIGRWWDIRSESARWRLLALWLHGSENVAAAAIKIDHEFNKLLSEALRTIVDWILWPQLREPLYATFDDYVDAVRRELSLPRLASLRAGAAVRQTPAATADDE